ncbi:MAG: hypothetical protein HRU75_13825 [Planctomycetia bacterium]|nr:MAG: hypothetical protein HRU75_13825 [Planctomycetia bacterium]
MKTFRITFACVALLSLPINALGADAHTSATANNRPGGSAQATARYSGDHGFARTSSATGPVNVARGVAVGVDENGVALSLSTAVAPGRGPAIASTFNLNIGRDGDVSTANGVSIARGGQFREVTASGSAGSHRPAVALAGGRTDPRGRVIASTQASSHRPLPVIERRRLRR